MALIDLIGKRFGRLLVVSCAGQNKYRELRWNCICECSKTITVRGYSLRSGWTKSCGCLQQELTSKACFKNLVGKQFGKWTVLNISNKTGEQILYNCKCKCGIEATVNASNLRGKGSMGCRHCGHSKPHSYAAKNRFFCSCRADAERRNRKFHLSFNYFVSLCSENCFYCGCIPNQISKSNAIRSTGDWIHHGIDRVNNDIGYIKSNCVSCCIKCNLMKRKMKLEEFITHTDKIRIHQITKEIKMYKLNEYAELAS